MMPPPAPAPTTTALTWREDITCSRQHQDRSRARGFPAGPNLEISHLKPESYRDSGGHASRHLRIVEPEHLPADRPAVASVARTAVEALHAVVANQAEELGRLALLPDARRRLTGLQQAEQRRLVVERQIQEGPLPDPATRLVQPCEPVPVDAEKPPVGPAKLDVD